MNEERGSAAIVIAGVTALLAVGTIAVASLAAIYGARAQAILAADAAALAAAPATYPSVATGTPAQVAEAYVEANGAVLVACDCRVNGSLEARVVTVRAGVGVDVPLFGRHMVHATSRAEFEPRLWLGR